VGDDAVRLARLVEASITRSRHFRAGENRAGFSMPHANGRRALKLVEACALLEAMGRL
jgi:hypothetical protein